MQPNFFDHEDRLELLERLGDPLPKLDKTVQWEAFRKLLSSVYRKGDPSKGGRPPFDAVLMFKVLVLQHFYNLSDDQTEFQIRDRYSFCRFLNITPQERVPDAKTIWLFRERLKKLELMEKLKTNSAGTRPDSFNQNQTFCCFELMARANADCPPTKSMARRRCFCVVLNTSILSPVTIITVTRLKDTVKTVDESTVKIVGRLQFYL
ncbi:hypothetical protein BOW51_09720 [Solemya velesiana gill symbiont]|uniref:Transposase InsH N-terminal domain-containing protein n=1 Tax=Solemya velesiana gill symbiont TaxID=1918948 RepID=A0A1T2KSR3_9GAMM|nr:hypothetical protein BOW51_09720 [Solemya velesiana gill symbiont]